MINHLNSCLPEEGCGLLAGRDHKIIDVLPVENVLHSPTAYRMHPAQQIRGMLGIEASGLELIGFYHSHPIGDALPSETDILEATYPDELYLIVSFESDPPQIGGFFIRNGTVCSQVVKIEP